MCATFGRCGLTLAVLAIATAVSEGVAHGQIPFRDLQAIARAGIANGQVSFIKPWVTMGGGEVHYDLGGISFAPVFEDDDPDYIPLKGLLYIELIKHHYKKGPNDRLGLTPGFWQGPVAAAEAIVAREIALIAGSKRGDPKVEDQLRDLDFQIMGTFRGALDDYAKAQGLTMVNESKPRAAMVDVRVSPDSASLQMMHVFEWYICQKRGINPETVMPRVGSGPRLCSGEYIYKMSVSGQTVVRPNRVSLGHNPVAVFYSNGAVDFPRSR